MNMLKVTIKRILSFLFAICIVAGLYLVVPLTVGTAQAETPTSIKLWHDPEREFTITANGTEVTVSGNFDSRWVRPSNNAGDIESFLHMEAYLYPDNPKEHENDAQLASYYSFLQRYCPINTEPEMNTGFYPYGGRVRIINNTAHFIFDDVPHGKYVLEINTVVIYRGEYGNYRKDIEKYAGEHFFYFQIEVTSRGIEFVISENYAANKAHVDSYKPPVGQEYIQPQRDTVKAKAAEITEGITSPYQKAKAIYQWVVDNITTQFGVGYFLFGGVPQMAEEILEYGDGIMPILLEALLNAAGIPARHVTGASVSSTTMWTEAYINGRWIIMNPTREYASRNQDRIPLNNFDQSIEYFSTLHAYQSSGTSDAPSPAPVASLTATPTTSTVIVNGKEVSFDAYNINGNNYFKLRDLAFILSGTEKQFEVGWDGIEERITLTSGKPYTAVGGEMTGKGTGAKTPTPTSSKIILDDEIVQFTAYFIEGNNYFKLRDIGAAFDFGVDWDGANSTIVIETSRGYTP